MKEQEFIETMVDIMDTDEEFNLDTQLSTLEDWDSLSYVSFLAMAKQKAKNTIMPDDVRDAKTVRDLYELLGE